MKPLRFIYLLTLAVVAFMAALLIFSTFPIPGNYKILVVLSGSMAPNISLGSLVFVKPLDSYDVGEVVTYKNNRDPAKSTTHRIVERKSTDGGVSYITKGDANNAPDSEPVSAEDIVGKALFGVPLLGFAVVAVKKPIGFFLLILLPATMIIYDELRRIKDEVKKMRAKTAVLAVFILSVSLTSVSSMTNAFYSDAEKSLNNLFQAASWDTWIQTTRADFDAGVLSNVDTSTVPDEVRLTGAYPKDGNTVALWHMNEGSGTTAGDSGDNHNDGTINGASWTSGKYGSALDFDGVDDYVNAPDNSTLDFGISDFTVEAWINVDGSALSSNQEYGVVNKNATFQNSPGWGLEIHTYGGSDQGKFRVEFYITGQSSWGNTNVKSDINQTSGVWHHVAGVRQGTTTRLYWDGVLVAEKTHTDAGLSVDNNEPVIIGDHSWGPNFPGMIDEVRISNVVRSSFPVSYFPSGTLQSQRFDGGGTREWDNLVWDETLAPGTDITIEVATSSDGSAWSAWQLSSSVSPIDLTGLTPSQYFKWRATLTTTDSNATPILQEVRVKHFSH